MLCSWREFSFDQLAEQKGGWGMLVKHPGLVHRSASLLKSREKFLPRRCNQRLCRCMPVSADNHRCLLYLFRVGRIHDVHHIKATQCGKAFFPRHSRTFSLNFLRHILGQGFEVLRIVEGQRFKHHPCLEVASKQLKAGVRMAVAKEPRKKEGGKLQTITAHPHVGNFYAAFRRNYERSSSLIVLREQKRIS